MSKNEGIIEGSLTTPTGFGRHGSVDSAADKERS